MTRTTWISFAALLGLGACTQPGVHKQHGEPVENVSGHDLETIAILGTNDIHGALAPQAAKTVEANGTAPIEYERGGATMLASYVRELQSEFGDRLVWLEAGDQ